MRIAIDAVKSGFKNPKDTFKWLINTVEARRRPFDPEHALDIIADVTETERQQIESYYEEITGPVAELYNSRFQKMITESPGSHIRRRVLGFERWIGIDRIAWYCLLRAESPSTVVETGVLRGESSLFALEALRRNGGEVVSFDIGREAMPEFHPWPTHEEEVGFFVPDDLHDSWQLIIGDSVEEIRKHGSLEPVDVFYHDSKHTYEHIYNELESILPYMADDGLAIAEDIDGMSVFGDFLEEYTKITSGEWRYTHTKGGETGITRLKKQR
jgi:cephalosporin hydroxylase